MFKKEISKTPKRQLHWKRHFSPSRKKNRERVNKSKLTLIEISSIDPKGREHIHSRLKIIFMTTSTLRLLRLSRSRI
jgi:hypothetical protein